MLKDLSTKDYEDLVGTVMEKLQSGLHLEMYDSRRSFVHSICSEQLITTCTCAMQYGGGCQILGDVQRMHVKKEVCPV